MVNLGQQAAAARRVMEPAWNDLREQRVLGRVQESVRARGNTSRKRAVTVVAASLIAAAAAFVFYMRARSVAPAALPSVALVAPAAPPASPARIALLDGSEATLSPDALVRVDEQLEDQVQLTQSAGEVKYDVRHEPKRRFTVRAGDVSVRVRGTAFTVELSSGKVRVRVLRGKVEVDGGQKVIELSAGESVEVAAYRKTFDEPSPVPSVVPVSSVDKKVPVTVEALLARADVARVAKRYDEAALALRTLVAEHPGDPRVASALFTLGRVERSRGRHAAAAEAFARCYKVAPHGSLAEDALAEEAASWKSAGDKVRASAAAKRYLDMHPSGAHAARMMPLVE